MPELRHAPKAFRVEAAADGGPLPEESIRDIMRHCRQMGVWISVWTADGAVCCVDDDGPQIWTVLWSRSQPARAALARAARSALDGDLSPPHGPWGGTLGLLSIPIRHRSRMAGVVIAGWVCRAPDEDFLRLCDQAKLDAAALRRMAAAVPAHPDPLARSWRPMLELLVHQARQLEITRQKIEAFTSNLDATYEELNLIYGFGDYFPLDESPDATLNHLGDDVLAVSGTAGLAFLLAPSGAGGAGGPAPSTTAASSESAIRNPQSAIRPGSPPCRLICVGRIPAEPQSLLRLTESLGVAPPAWAAVAPPAGFPRHVVRNRAREYADLAWTSPWLDHVVALPLGRNGRYLGVMLAINRTDGAEFNSVHIKFLRAVADRLTSFLEKKRLYDDLAELSMGMLHALVSSIDAKDPYTCGHSERVAVTSRLLARQFGFAPAACERVYLAGLLHDVGKIGVPDAILCKPGKLTEEEFTILRRHPEIGAKILSRIRQVEDLLPGILYHHERMDGRGYPHGLAGQQIPILGRIICLADCFDAMTTNRTYRAALPVTVALAEVRRCAGTQFDPLLAEKFFEIDLQAMLGELNALRSSVPPAAIDVGCRNWEVGHSAGAIPSHIAHPTSPTPHPTSDAPAARQVCGAERLA